MKSALALAVSCGIALLTSLPSQADSQSFEKQHKTDVIHRVAKALEDRYVLIDKGKLFSEELLSLNAKGAFDETITKDDFIKQLNSYLRTITNDKHVSVRPEQNGQSNSRRMIRRVASSDSGTTNGGQRRVVRVATPAEMDRNISMRSMMGMPEGKSIRSEILPGNIGVLTVSDLMGSMSEIDSAMAKISDADGILIDLRQCPGGSGTLSGLINSYFLPEGVEINRLKRRGQEDLISMSQKLPEGAKRQLNKPLYLVTSSFTGSACEALSFAQKYHQTGILIGETTAGAGHASTQGLAPVGHGLSVFVPDSMPVHPKVKGGFEKSGVTPQIEINASMALDVAYQTMLSRLISEQGKKPVLVNALTNVGTKINRHITQHVTDSLDHKDFVGQYDQQNRIVMRKGQLHWVSAQGRYYPLVSESKDTFVSLLSSKDISVRIERDETDKIVGLSIRVGTQSPDWQYRAKVDAA